MKRLDEPTAINMRTALEAGINGEGFAARFGWTVHGARVAAARLGIVLPRIDVTTGSAMWKQKRHKR